MSCFFCDSTLHLSQFCDTYKTNKSRIAIGRKKDYCCKCFKPNRICNRQQCRHTRRCYICYTKEHHTFLCSKKKAYQLFIPSAINHNLLPRFYQMFDPIEQIQFAFDPDFDTFYNFALVKILSKPFNQYSNVRFPESCKIFYQCEMFAESRTPTFDSLMPKLYCVFSKIIHLKNLQLSAVEFLSILSQKTEELICESVTATSEVKFSEILFITKNIQKLEFTETNVIVENSWPKELVKNVRLKKFVSLRLTINHIDFDVEALATFFKEKATKDAHMTIFIDMQMDYQTINKTIAEKFESHFKRISTAPNHWQWIMIRFNEISEEDMLIRHTLGTFTLKYN